MRLRAQSPIVLSFRSSIAREVAFFLFAVFRAAVISYFVFAAFVYPLYNLRWFGSVLIAMARVLYLPIDWLGYLIPPLRSPFSLPGEWDQRWLLVGRHMLSGIVTYVLVFYIPTGIRFARRHIGPHAERA